MTAAITHEVFVYIAYGGTFKHTFLKSRAEADGWIATTMGGAANHVEEAIVYIGKITEMHKLEKRWISEEQLVTEDISVPLAPAIEI